MKKLLFLVVSFLLVSAQANALDITVDETNDPNVPFLSWYAQITINETAPNIFSFNVDANDALWDGVSTNFGIQTFAFNTTITSIDANWFDLPTDWSATVGSFNTSEFGIFFTRTDADQGNDRLDPLIFSITVPGDPLDPNYTENDFVVANEDGYYFSLHIADIGPYDNNVTSAWFGGTDDGGGGGGGGGDPVPEPGTLLLLGFGLLGISGATRRKRIGK